MFSTAFNAKNLITSLQTKAQKIPQQCAYLFTQDGTSETARITYSELDQKARTIAAYLQNQQILAQQRVLLLYPTGLDFIAAFMGCLYAGVIAVPVSCPAPAEFAKSQALLNAIAQDADISCILTTAAYITNTQTLWADFLADSKLFITDTTGLNAELAGFYQEPIIQAEAIAYLQYTSGSTSTPKGVVIQYKNLTHSLKETITAWRYIKDSVTLTWAPHSHVYGLICGLLVPLYHGSLAILMPPHVFIQHPLRWLTAITKYRVTHSGCPNFGYDLCVQEINENELTNIDLSSWQFAINGGENIQSETLLKFTEKFSTCGFQAKTFCPAYGMSEVTGAIASDRYDKEPTALCLQVDSFINHEIKVVPPQVFHRKIVSSGYLLSGLDAIVVDPDTLQPSAQEKIGEIWLTGKSLAAGYWQRPEETQAIFKAKLPNTKQEYFRTGDLGFIANKQIFLTGRLKEIIVLYGKKHYPADLETSVKAVLQTLTDKCHNIVFSIPIASKDEIIFLQEIKEETTEEAQNEIINIIQRCITEQHGINLYGIVLIKTNSLPKTASGKLQRRLCQEKFTAGKFSIIKQHFKNFSTVSPVENTITNPQQEFINLIASVLHIDPSIISFDNPISEYGFDSIKIIRLATLLNDKYDLTLTPANLFEYATLGACFTDLIIKSNTKKTNDDVPVNIPITGANNNDIAIIGISGIFPDANNVEQLWNNLEQGIDVISEIPPGRWDWQTGENKWGGFIENPAQFDADFFSISPREAELMDPQQRLLLQTVWQTVEDAGYSSDEVSKINTGLFIGVFSNDYAELLQKNNINDAYVTTGITSNMLANRISFLLNLRGPSVTINTACSSSLVALHQAVLAIQNGDCENALVGGVNLLLAPTLYTAAVKAGMLSEDGHCKTFDKQANGYVRAEGMAAIFLKPLSKAQSDGDHIYGLIKGTAVNHGGSVNSLTAPNPNAQADVIATACRRAQIPVDTITYIETHGTGTALGDPIEINGLKKAFTTLCEEQDKKTLTNYYCALGAIKTNIGHLESAAGIAGLIKVLLAMQHGAIPGNLHFNELNSYIDLNETPFYIVTKTQAWSRIKDENQQEIPRRAGVSSFGFGGTNAHVIVEEFISEPAAKIAADGSYLILLSAKTEIALQQRIADLHNWLLKQTVTPSLSAISYTLNTGRKHFAKRCAFIVNSITELTQQLNNLLQNQQPILDSNNPLTTLAHSYLAGEELNLADLYQEKKQRIALPTYPFAKTEFWCSNSVTLPTQDSKNNSETKTTLHYYQPIWVDMPFVSPPTLPVLKAKDILLVFATDEKILLQLNNHLPANQIILVQPAAHFSVIAQNIYTINPIENDHYIELLAILKKTGCTPSHVVHLWSESVFANELAIINKQINISLASLLLVSQSLLTSGIKNKLILLFAYLATPSKEQPIFAALAAFAKTLTLEYAQLDCRVLEIRSAETNFASINSLSTILFAELQTTEKNCLHVRYEQERRMVKTIIKINNEQTNNAEPITLKLHGVYIITGGMGNLGFVFAEYLARSIKAKLVLIGRSALNEEKLKKIQQLKNLGGEAIYLTCDIAQQNDVTQLVNNAKQRFGDINGIIHTAGIVQEKNNLPQNSEKFKTVLAPKIAGTLFLDATTRKEPLDFFILFSSIAAVTGGSSGQSDYASANAFIDNYAYEREVRRHNKTCSGKTIAINWPLWETVGMDVDPASLPALTAWLKKTMGTIPLTKQQGLEAFLTALKMNQTQFIVAAGDAQKITSTLEQVYQINYPVNIPEAIPAPIITSHNKLPPTNSLVPIQQDLIKHIMQLLKVNAQAIDLNRSLTEFGFDSISLKEFAARLEQHYNINLTPAIFFAHNNIQALSQYLLSITQSSPVSHSAVSKEPEINTEDTSIAVIGMHGLFPQAKDLAAFWQHLAAGTDLITEIPSERWDWREYYDASKSDPAKAYSKWGGFIPDVDKFDAAFFNLSTREANLMDPQHRLFLETVWKTIEDAGYDPLTFSGQDAGVFVGVEFNEYKTLSLQQKIFHGHTATGNAHSMLANRVSYFLNLHGPSEAIDTACSSALVAINRAVHALRAGECTTAIAGGANLMLDPQTVIVASQLGVLSPDGHCKTFDKSANGYVKGEGVAAILLKPLTKALTDGDHIYGVIKSTVVNHGGKAQSLTAPNTNAQSQLLIKAYTQAHIDPATVTYIETHGTGTELGDPVEIEGIKQAFNTLLSTQPNAAALKNICGLGSVKTNIGHLEPAAGIAGVIKVLLAMKHGKIPGNLHCDEVNPYIQLANSPFYIVNKTQPWERLRDASGAAIPYRAGVSSFGFGGANAHVVIEEAPSIRNADKKNSNVKPYYLVTLSAKQEASLKQKIVDLHDWLILHAAEITLSNLSFTLNNGRSHFNVRCALVVSSLEELTTTLAALNNQQQPENCLINLEQNINLQGPLFTEIYRTTIAAIENFSALTAQEYYEKLLLLADLYTKNYPVEWQRLYAAEKLQRLTALPTYPFIKQRYWFDAELPAAATITESFNTTKIETNHSSNLADFTLHYLQQIFSEVLRIPATQIAADSTYEVYGVNSLLGMEIIRRLENNIGVIPKTLLFEKKCLRELAAYFQENYLEKLQQIYKQNNLVGTLRFAHPTFNVLSEPRAQASGTQSPVPLPSGRGSVSQILNVGWAKERSDVPTTNNLNNKQDIAIIGLSGTYPMAQDIQQFWQNLLQGRDCISEVPLDRWDYKKHPVSVGGETKYYRYGGFIEDADKFDPLFFNIAPSDAALMDPQERLFLQCAWATFEDAGYTREKLKKTINNKVGVFAGTTYNFYPLFIAEEWNKGHRLPLNIQTFSIANRVSYFLDLSGPSYVIDTACSSSLAAIHLACESLLNNECKMALTGGVNLSLHPCKYHMLGSYSFLSEQGRCASFAADGQGYASSEGVGCVLLKPLAAAIEDGDRIYGIIKGSSMNHDGKTSGYTVPNPTAQAELITNALEKTQIDPRTISYIEAHGTGTSLGDPIEIRGLQQAFEHYTTDKQFCAIGSVKSNIGHLEAAAGIAQLTKVLLQLQYKKLVPSIHAEQLNPYIDFAQTPFYVQRQLSDWSAAADQPRRAAVSSFGAGGANVHMIVEEFIPAINNKNNNIHSNTKTPFIFLLSAINKERLQEYAQHVYTFLLIESEKQQGHLDEWLLNVCYTSQIGRESMPIRWAFVASSYPELLEKIKNQQAYAATTAQMPYEELISAWLAGNNVNWEILYDIAKPKKVFIPTYPFAKRRCWIPIAAPISTQTSITEWLYQTRWEPAKTATVKNIPNNSGHSLIFSDHELGFSLQDVLDKPSCIYCFTGEKFEQIADNIFYINPSRHDDYCQLLSRISNIKEIIYLWATLDETEQNKSAENLLLFLQALLQSSHKKLQFCLVTRGAQAVTANDSIIHLWQHYLWSLARVFSSENPSYKVLLLDLAAAKHWRADANSIAHEIQHFKPEETHIAYREAARYVLRLSTYIQEATHDWVAPQTVLITGGLGALGIEVAQWLVTQGTKHLLLIGNTVLPERSEWSNVQTENLREKINAIMALEKSGAQVNYAAVDVRDKLALQAAIKTAEQTWQKTIEGVFHLAGVTTDSVLITKMNEQILQQVLSVKTQGALVLHDLFKTSNLNCFVLFSSTSAMPYFGINGLSAYAMSNEFLDGLAVYRRRQGLPAISINWATWAEKGMGVKYNHLAFLEAVGMSPIPITQGMAILHYLLRLSVQPETIAVFKVQWEKLLKVNPEFKRLAYFSNFSATQLANTDSVPEIKWEHSAITILLTNTLAGLLTLEVEEVNADTPMQNYGMDSIIGINFIAKLGEYFPDTLSPMDIYRYPTLSQLANHILQTRQITPETKNSPTISKHDLLTDIIHLNDQQIAELIEDELLQVNEAA